MGYSLQANCKNLEGVSNSDREPQFVYINGQVKTVLAAGRVVMVDTKKKELVGDFKNGGPACRPKGSPRRCAGTTS